MADARAQLVEVIRERGLRPLDEPVQLRSGDWSRHFVDGKRALARGADLALAARVLLEATGAAEIDFDAVGGLTMGADHLAHATAVVAGEVEWFSVRKQAKDRGTRQRVEGAVLGPGRRVLLVEDAVTRAGSIVEALHAVRETGATVVGAVAMVDRGHDGRRVLGEEGVPYVVLVTFDDLGIPPVGSEPGAPSAAAG